MTGNYFALREDPYYIFLIAGDDDTDGWVVATNPADQVAFTSFWTSLFQKGNRSTERTTTLRGGQVRMYVPGSRLDMRLFILESDGNKCVVRVHETRVHEHMPCPTDVAYNPDDPRLSHIPPSLRDYVDAGLIPLAPQFAGERV
jgi:hypothetical protein